ncbi:hypothetical protein CHS0354_033495 [Potamilus streckersoni]|uniref:Uncharacterized protein n=1 Tax=Potamilus streckersoni TaxID=2493646 RepID=A0AAE0SBT2_9BIVA|nr:hypothetical protein CHS0354_033495 [Potamilus streckersoni]
MKKRILKQQLFMEHKHVLCAVRMETHQRYPEKSNADNTCQPSQGSNVVSGKSTLSHIIKRDHCHVTGHYERYAHAGCNRRFKDPDILLVITQNPLGYDHHLSAQSSARQENVSLRTLFPSKAPSIPTYISPTSPIRNTSTRTTSKTLRVHQNLCLKTDVLLFTDIFETLRHNAWIIANFISSSIFQQQTSPGMFSSRRVKPSFNSSSIWICFHRTHDLRVNFRHQPKSTPSQTLNT